MEFPASWNVFPAEDFSTAEARSPGVAGMELMVQMRPNGTCWTTSEWPWEERKYWKKTVV
jgi:hypothetical protein